MGRPASALALALALGGLACATVREERGVAGGTRAAARVAGSTLYRYLPPASLLDSTGGPRVLLVPEVGFDHALFAPLCERLARRGFDVLAVDPAADTASLADWALAVARAARLHGGHPKVLAVGLGGEAAFVLARAGGAGGIVAVNVPLQHRVGNVALASALAADLYAPRRWGEHGRARLLLGGGRVTPEADLDVLEATARPVPEPLARELALLLARRSPVLLPEVPIRVLASLKDNLVHPEDAMLAASPDWHPTSARRLGRIEFFGRDYGHLDWLASDAALDDLVPTIADELEALP